MGLLASDEVRLLYTAVLNALVLLSAWHAARRWSPDPLDAAGDTFLLYYLIQYISVSATGVVGAMHALTIGLVALFCSVVIALGTWRRKVDRSALPVVIDRRSTVVIAASCFFVVGYVTALVWHQRQLPVISNDAITYHLPAAAQWLQTGKLGLYEAWYYNPANSYSPLAGSTFIAWLLAPVRSDVLARFVQVGPLLMLFVVMLNLLRRLGAQVGIAALIAAAAVLARPFVSQTILAKDDLFVAAFLIAALDAMARDRLTTRFGPWRVGIALGLLLATKFTVLFSLPILLLAIGRGWTPKRIVITGLCAFVLAGPWYLRNINLTGNPLYPMDLAAFGTTLLTGMFHVTRSRLLSTPSGVWDVFTNGYYGLPAMLAIVSWIIAAWMNGMGALRDPLKRAMVIGPIIGIALFIVAAPYGEMRFAYPSVLLMFGMLALVLSRLPWSVGIAAGAVIVLLAALTAFRMDMAWPFVKAALTCAAIIGAIAATSKARMITAYASVVLMLFTALSVYVYWRPYVRQCAQDSAIAWSWPSPRAYGQIGDLWAFVRNDLPLGSSIAYANTWFTYPLMGYRYDHRVQYVPTRDGLNDFVAMPRLTEPVTGEEITRNIVDLLRENPNREQWLRRLRDSGAEYLVVAKQDPAEPSKTVVPPELIFAGADHARFVLVFDNEAGAVFRIVW